MKSLMMVAASLLLICCACEDTDRYYDYKSWTMEILNDSEQEVNIVIKSNSQPNLNIDTTLQVNGTFTLTEGDNDPVAGKQDLLSMRVLDSSIVSFNDNKKLVYWFNSDSYSWSDSSRNILFEGNYALISTDGDHSNYRYTITDSDYQRAE